jgi:hypothetical protein
MAAVRPRSANSAIREVTRNLAAARDEQILRAVAMVDAMPDRGQADQIIAPLRPRLARLRPSRPLRFARLLFLPLDPLIVSAAHWRPTEPTLPRSVILPIAASVEAALGEAGARIAGLIADRTTHDLDVIEASGGLLWPLAAEILLKITPPPEWEAAGLPRAFHQPLAYRVGVLLGLAPRLRRFEMDAAHGLSPPDAATVREMVLEVMGHDPDLQPMLIALLLARIPDAAAVLSDVASSLGQSGAALLRGASENAAHVLLSRLEAPGGAEAQLGGDDLSEAAMTVRRLTALLSVLDGETAAPARKERLKDLRRRIGAGCESLFAERLESDLLDTLRTDGGHHRDLETVARGLRMLETEGRRIADGRTFDSLLEHATTVVREVSSEGTMDWVDAVRLTEILGGADAALALIEREARALEAEEVPA